MALQKIEKFQGLTKLAPAAIESHETEQSLRDATFAFEVQLHDLRSEFLHREGSCATTTSRKSRQLAGQRNEHAAAFRRAILEIVLEHERAGMLPTSARFIYYELIAREIISKERTDQNMIDALTVLREKGDIPWHFIADETRELSDYTGYKSMREAVLAGLKYARLDAWSGNPPMIITESRSLAGVLRSLVTEFASRIASTNGQCAGFLHNDVVPALKGGGIVLYLGDDDFSGISRPIPGAFLNGTPAP